jgi:cardiolipin synthase
MARSAAAGLAGRAAAAAAARAHRGVALAAESRPIACTLAPATFCWSPRPFAAAAVEQPTKPSPPPPKPSTPPLATTWAATGWTRANVATAANAVSAARLAAAPAAYALIASGAHPGPALALVAAAGVSDWVDGWLARRQGGGSGTPLGSYLDPLADKAFTCAAVAGAASAGLVPEWLAAAVVGRDATLVAGAVGARAAACGWAWPGGPEFFRLVEEGTDGDAQGDGAGLEAADAGDAATPTRAATVPPPPPIRPLSISKANTVLQFATLAAALGGPAAGWPPEGAVVGLAVATAGTTAASGAAYVGQWWKEWGRRRQ